MRVSQPILHPRPATIISGGAISIGFFVAVTMGGGSGSVSFSFDGSTAWGWQSAPVPGSPSYVLKTTGAASGTGPYSTSPVSFSAGNIGLIIVGTLGTADTPVCTHPDIKPLGTPTDPNNEFAFVAPITVLEPPFFPVLGDLSISAGQPPTGGISAPIGIDFFDVGTGAAWIVLEIAGSTAIGPAYLGGDDGTDSGSTGTITPVIGALQLLCTLSLDFAPTFTSPWDTQVFTAGS